MFRVEVEFKSHASEVMLELNLCLADLCKTGAVVLRDAYYQQLTRRQAKPHSRVGRVPYAYDGPDLAPQSNPFFIGPAQFDRTDGRKNNLAEDGFAQDQTDFLAEYLDTDGGGVGFQRTGHVARRSQNYLISWDGSDKSYPHTAGNRPWIKKIYRSAKKEMIAAVRSRLNSGSLGKGSEDVPF